MEQQLKSGKRSQHALLLGPARLVSLIVIVIISVNIISINIIITVMIRLEASCEALD